ncbi:CcoQ/FixQ family Cbb3-type cytochrome c oxidase assembly chaperone [Cognatishimia activa]|uniref:Cbb3-type cytochrome oxidase, subunit 3 n=1 Tax=Cognatishimia activa TaxID=1715691 RepID=A0A0P1IQZ0_9RHOB|nr:CcoQ/FixQ family Cbb3-type cytochrome c oxidase assembly chaperone [Cognatishimia activa]MEE2944482.1 CcoQ/FixQ family Cbb3-type cytochrome c oxidase assembly chaperone [Pseudomonadota bacterium]CUJ05826.1 Cbb3-type cytochrome oxidase, subunit 3 [Cognatishimia activa]CUK26028.1 Cbb3-type cytochrome oxidase, subunit 3 [Cognatishimia activa]
METYSLLREFADSWMLLFLFTFFVAVILWVFRPGSRSEYQETADIPFRHADKPAPAAATEKEAQP